MPMSATGAKSNRRLATVLVAFVASMIGLSFAAVPLYRMFCAATGYGGTPQRALSAPGKIYPQIVAVRLDANVAPGMPWRFEPEQPDVQLHVGENKLAFFRATNRSNETVTGWAVFNVSPGYMGAYFTKIQCFCFNALTLGPGETVEMPVSFFLDPAMLADSSAKSVRDMTLSYTFFRVKPPEPDRAVKFLKTNADGPAMAVQKAD
jgi:cytochrome c oxidase assembly protein subunit 11